MKIRKWSLPVNRQLNNPAQDDSKVYWRCRLYENNIGVKFINGKRIEEWKEDKFLNFLVHFKWFLNRLSLKVGDFIVFLIKSEEENRLKQEKGGE